jgi:DNA-binding MarR family transcriptional regulator
MRATSTVALLAALALLTTSVAAQAPDAGGLTNGTVQKGKSLVDKVADGLGSAAKGVGNAAGSAVDGVGSAAGAVGRFMQAVAQAVADGARAALQAAAEVAGLAARALADAASATGVAALDGLTALGSSAGAGLAAVGDGLAAVGTGLAAAGRVIGDGLLAAAQATGAAFAWVAAQVAALASLYMGLVASLRPRALPEPAFAALASAGAAATAGAAGYGLFDFARRFGWAAGLPGMAGFSRIEDDELLKHPLRAQVFQVIQGNPGIHASELGRRMGSGWGTIVHHLDKLEKGRLVAIRKVNNQKCYFEAGGKVSRQDMAVAGAVRGDSANRITSYVASHPMTSQKALAGDLGISPALTSFHVKKLVGLGVLDKVRNGKETLLTTTDALRRIVAGESAAVAPPVMVGVPTLSA